MYYTILVYILQFTPNAQLYKIFTPICVIYRFPSVYDGDLGPQLSLVTHTNIPIATRSAALRRRRNMKPRAVVFVLIDGLADVSLAQLDGQTTLQAARTPAMDAIARESPPLPPCFLV